MQIKKLQTETALLIFCDDVYKNCSSQDQAQAAFERRLCQIQATSELRRMAQDKPLERLETKL